MSYLLKYLTVFLFSLTGIAQNSIDEAIQKYNSGSVDYIEVETLKTKLDAGEDIVLLDTRAKAEFDVSHLKNAIWIGYDNFKKENVKQLDKNTEIVVYCSIGVRSEQIGERLKNMGFKNIQNLYGGIFDWVNRGYPIYKNSKQTKNVHAYDKFWGKFLERGNKILE
ncbi:rhodanese-like domain-containing protein [Flavobacteriaceae bacterium 14752]|uniref:rhodanese-like domain-containing protein n=1 Tax=Mesohalobacter salilacus TaxID=2491711 RepID=UPI000F63402C|nr:rhodanese-like domain-containing protein [Flavobacteriaceae bacterium 14752]